MGEASGTVLIVGNPYSGKGRAHAVASAVVAELAKRGYAAREVWEVEERRAVLGQTVAESAEAPYCCLVVVGGDGTLNAVLNECRTLPIAIVPMGHENLLAKWLGHTAEPPEVARLVAEGRERVIDLGRVNGRYFAAVASAGLDAWVVERIARWRMERGGEETERNTRTCAEDGSSSARGGRARRGIGLANYLAAIAAAAWSYDYPAVDLEADGKIYRGYHAMVFNAPAYAWGMCAAKGARVDDGLLDWVVFERRGRVAALRYGLQLLGGKDCKGVASGRAERVRVTAKVQVPTEVDGDVLGQTPVELEVAGGAGRFLVSR